MQSLLRVACLLLTVSALAIGQQGTKTAGAVQPVSLRDLVPAGDALAKQDLLFDASFAQLALQYMHSRDPGLLDQMANSPAAAHLLHHARNFNYDVPKDSAKSLVSHLLTSSGKHIQVATCERSVAYFTGPMLGHPRWVNDTLRYLPDDFRFHGTLFLIFGYDIGVALGPAASLNCGHSHFAVDPRELKYYAIHELHHQGFMAYQPPPHLSEIKTCSDLLHLVQYSTQLEGVAVLAAYERRRQEEALSGDEDYVALQDEARMQRDEKLYFADLHYLEKRGLEPVDPEAWAVIDRMSSGERLWYRVGARMAQKIEQAAGRPTLVTLIPQGPARFLQVYGQLAGQQVKLRQR